MTAQSGCWTSLLTNERPIRCLDEGVDIPETRRAYILASSTNPKQFIQRRGRILRRFPGKELAEIHDFIERLPKGYNTELGEHGVGLSGGQKQRLAIARAVLKRPRVLIFDEAASNLDAQTAERFAQTVNQLKGKVTIVFIAHQLPRGLQVDEVFTLTAEKATQMRVIDEAQT